MRPLWEGEKNPEASGVTVHRAFNQQPSKTLWFIYLNHDTYFCRMHPIILLVFVFSHLDLVCFSGVLLRNRLSKSVRCIHHCSCPVGCSTRNHNSVPAVVLCLGTGCKGSSDDDDDGGGLSLSLPLPLPCFTPHPCRWNNAVTHVLPEMPQVPRLGQRQVAGILIIMQSARPNQLWSLICPCWALFTLFEASPGSDRVRRWVIVGLPLTCWIAASAANDIWQTFALCHCFLCSQGGEKNEN